MDLDSRLLDRVRRNMEVVRTKPSHSSVNSDRSDPTEAQFMLPRPQGLEEDDEHSPPSTSGGRNDRSILLIPDTPSPVFSRYVGKRNRNTSSEELDTQDTKRTRPVEISSGHASEMTDSTEQSQPVGTSGENLLISKLDKRNVNKKKKEKFFSDVPRLDTDFEITAASIFCLDSNKQEEISAAGNRATLRQTSVSDHADDEKSDPVKLKLDSCPEIQFSRNGSSKNSTQLPKEENSQARFTSALERLKAARQKKKANLEKHQFDIEEKDQQTEKELVSGKNNESLYVKKKGDNRSDAAGLRTADAGTEDQTSSVGVQGCKSESKQRNLEKLGPLNENKESSNDKSGCGSVEESESDESDKDDRNPSPDYSRQRYRTDNVLNDTYFLPRIRQYPMCGPPRPDWRLAWSSESESGSSEETGSESGTEDEIPLRDLLTTSNDDENSNSTEGNSSAQKSEVSSRDASASENDDGYSSVQGKNSKTAISKTVGPVNDGEAGAFDTTAHASTSSHGNHANTFEYQDIDPIVIDDFAEEIEIPDVQTPAVLSSHSSACSERGMTTPSCTNYGNHKYFPCVTSRHGESTRDPIRITTPVRHRPDRNISPRKLRSRRNARDADGIRQHRFSFFVSPNRELEEQPDITIDNDVAASVGLGRGAPVPGAERFNLRSSGRDRLTGLRRRRPSRTLAGCTRNSSIELLDPIDITGTAEDDDTVTVAAADSTTGRPHDDPVRIVQQMENDEDYARQLQEQMDLEFAMSLQNRPSTPSAEDPGIPIPGGIGHHHHGNWQNFGASRARSGRLLPPLLLDPEDEPDEMENSETPFGTYPLRDAPVERRVRMQHYTDALARMETHILELMEEYQPEPTRRSRRRGHRSTARNRMYFPTFNVGDEYEHLLNLAEMLGEVKEKGLSKTQTGLLPVRTYIKPEEITENEKVDCLICMCEYEEGENLKILPCFHEFHTPCIDKWIQGNATCPVCRVVVKVE